MKKTKKMGYWLILSMLVIVAGFTAISMINIPGNYKLMTVLSGSMEPAIKTGSVVVVKQSGLYKINDIVTFKTVDSSVPVTHRIVWIKKNADNVSYITKGDANKSTDSVILDEEMIIGKEVFWVPFAGYGANFTRTRTGLFLLIIIPTVLIVINELFKIKNEYFRLSKK